MLPALAKRLHWWKISAERLTATSLTGRHRPSAARLLVDLVGVTLTNISQAHSPAGVAGEPINLALANRTGDNVGAVTATIAGVPTGWTLSEGTDNGDGTWTVQTNNASPHLTRYTTRAR